MSGLRPPDHPHRPDRAPGAPNLNMQRHVLVVTGETADEREFEIEHPDCPLSCYWSPSMEDIWAKGIGLWVGGVSSDKNHVDPGHRSCYVEYEVEGAGLDGLDLGDDPPDDGTYVPESQWSMDGWRRLPPGRYIIEPWYRQGQGLMPWGADEGEGGLNLVGPEPVDG